MRATNPFGWVAAGEGIERKNPAEMRMAESGTPIRTNQSNEARGALRHRPVPGRPATGSQSRPHGRDRRGKNSAAEHCPYSGSSGPAARKGEGTRHIESWER